MFLSGSVKAYSYLLLEWSIFRCYSQCRLASLADIRQDLKKMLGLTLELIIKKFYNIDPRSCSTTGSLTRWRRMTSAASEEFWIGKKCCFTWLNLSTCQIEMASLILIKYLGAFGDFSWLIFVTNLSLF
jgi:hypothetical protein